MTSLIKRAATIIAASMIVTVASPVEARKGPQAKSISSTATTKRPPTGRTRTKGKAYIEVPPSRLSQQAKQRFRLAKSAEAQKRANSKAAALNRELYPRGIPRVATKRLPLRSVLKKTNLDMRQKARGKPIIGFARYNQVRTIPNRQQNAVAARAKPRLIKRFFGSFRGSN